MDIAELFGFDGQYCLMLAIEIYMRNAGLGAAMVLCFHLAQIHGSGLRAGYFS